MANLLFVTSSLSGAASQSRAIAAEVVAAWRANHPGATVTERDLAADPVPHLGAATLGALATPAGERSEAQAANAGLADTLITEVEAADAIVLAAPMYNFTIPSTLKAWFDHVARAGRTFRYTPAGPVGQLAGRPVIVVMTRGGLYSEGAAKAMDFQEPYLRAMLSFLGLTDVSFVHAEGQALGAEAAAAGLAKARAALGGLAPRAAA